MAPLALSFFWEKPFSGAQQQSSCHKAKAPTYKQSVPLVVMVACFCLFAWSGVGEVSKRLFWMVMCWL